MTERVRVSIRTCAIMKCTKYVKNAYFGECFIGLLANWYALEDFL